MFRSLLSQKYQTLRKLAEGSMGEVYLARQVGESGFQREVVLKRIRHGLGEDPRAVELFLDEARLAAALSHPNVVRIHDVGEEEGAYLVAMERVRGLSLRELYEMAARLGQTLPMEHSLTIIAQVLEGLRYAHTFRDEVGRAAHVLHRDIRPSNILVSEDGVVKITDFGLARAESELRKELGPRPSRFAYLAPEAVRNEPLDGRADLFSVGVVLYELTVGQRLFRAATYQELKRIVDEPVPPPTFARAGYPVDLEILVMRALERNPEDRFESAEAMLDSLEQFAFDNGLRLSHLRLARFLERLMSGGTAAVRAPDESQEPEEAGSEVGADELDFDAHGLFDNSTPLGEASDEERAPLQRRERRRLVRDGVREAREAIADLVGKDAEDEPEEQHTMEMQVAEQARLRARTVEPEPPAGYEATRQALRDGSAVVVTDELIQEELDVSEPGADLLPEPPPLSEVVTEQELDLEDMPTLMAPVAGQVTPAAGTSLSAQGTQPDGTAEISGAGRTVSVTGSEGRAASADLVEALADISAELRAAEEADRRRVDALAMAIGADREPSLPAAGLLRATLNLRPAVAPPPAAVPPPPATLPPPLLLDGALQPPAGPLTSIAPVRDELEAADGASRRQPDDLELSDLARPPGQEQPPDGEEPQLEADGDTIILRPEEASEVSQVGPAPALRPPSPPPPPPPVPAPAGGAATPALVRPAEESPQCRGPEATASSGETLATDLDAASEPIPNGSTGPIAAFAFTEEVPSLAATEEMPSLASTQEQRPQPAPAGELAARPAPLDGAASGEQSAGDQNGGEEEALDSPTLDETGPRSLPTVLGKRKRRQGGKRRRGPHG